MSENTYNTDNLQPGFIPSEKDIMTTVYMRSSRLKGITGRLAENISKNWLIGLRETNPGILDMFRERDRLPYRQMLPWLGEFAGKYITGAYYIYRLTLDHALYDYIINFIRELMDCQAEDGYLGCFSRECRLTGSFSQKPEEIEGTWDAWNHYHIMYGMLLWFQETGDTRYLECVEKIAGLFLQKFYCPESGGKSLLELKSPETNLAPIHAFALLYRITGKQCYLTFCLEIERDIADSRAGNYIHCALNGIEYYQCPKPRWESLHIILGLAELYRSVGLISHKGQPPRADCQNRGQLPGTHYLQTVTQIYRSIQKTDVHNTGAFSTDEQAVGTPFQSGNIETCCVVAYNALAVELFKLTGDPSILDFLEIAHYNACMGAWSPTGRWSTYHTPMAGERRANYHDISFQSRAGSPDLNCCSVNAPRAVGMLSEWAVTKTAAALCINAYEDGDFVTENGVHIEISGGYPARNEIQILVENYTGELVLRIPGWSADTLLTEYHGGGSLLAPTSCSGRSLHTDRSHGCPPCSISACSPHQPASQQTCCGSPKIKHPLPGTYCPIDCREKIRITLSLDFTTRYLEGKEQYDGYVSIFRGPILFGTDISLAGGHDLQKLPVLKREDINRKSVPSQQGQILIPLPCGITLGDFYHLGQSGCQYTTWLQAD